MVLKLQSRDLYAIIESGQLNRNETHFAYNALDSAVTLRVHEALKPLIEASPHATTSYRFTRAMQGPAFSMMSKGIMVQQKVRQDETARYLSIREAAQRLLDRLADAVWGPEHYVERTKTQELHTPIGKRGQALTPRLRTITTEVNRQRPRGLNPASPKQVLAFFNGALGYEVLYEIRKTPQGTERTPSANDKALKRWADRRTKGPGIDVRDRTVYPVRLAAPFVSLILTIRDADKSLAVLRSQLDPDGRARCSYNVVGTENWRWSSSKNAFGRGQNQQNITPSMRRMYAADDGYRMVSTDLEQAESYVVAGVVWQMTGDRTYWDAILSGDLHTQVCRMAWPELPWTGEMKTDRRLANANYPSLKYSYRDVAKRIGHGCVTPDHEVLTPDGWVGIPTRPYQIMALGADGVPRWEFVSHWSEHLFDGDMYHFEGTSVSQVVTPNHRMIFSRDPGNFSKFTELPAEKWDAKGAIPLGWSYGGVSDEVSPEEARLIAAVQADGYVYPNGYVKFHFHKERKFERLQQLCDELGISCRRKNTYTTPESWRMYWPKAAGAYLLEWSKEALQAYSDEHRYWDGHIGKTAISISSINRTHLEWIQTVNRLIGKGGNIQKPHTSGFGSTIYVLQENNRRWASRDSMIKTKVPYKGPVYCPTVPTGMFFVRRNGKISATGNSNYMGSSYGIAQAVGIPPPVVEDFQRRYFLAFPGIPQYHQQTKRQLQEHQFLDTPLGQRRWFFGRPNEDSTLREAIAFIPQCTVASLLNLIMYKCWERSLLPPKHPNHLPIQLLLQNHDAFLFQSPLKTDLASLIEAVNAEFTNTPIPLIRGDEHASLTIPGEFVTGFNWAYADDPSKPCADWTFVDGNPDGLAKWSGSDTRTRTQRAAVSPADWLTSGGPPRTW